MNDRICIACKHFVMSPETAGYSSWTPGDPAEVSCSKNHWTLGEFAAAELFENNLKARECPDFAPSGIAIKHGWQP